MKLVRKWWFVPVLEPEGYVGHLVPDENGEWKMRMRKGREELILGFGS